MGALPKQKTSKARKGRRRSHLHLEMPPLETCQQCGTKKVTHHVCPECGTYRGKQIFAIKEATTTE